MNIAFSGIKGAFAGIAAARLYPGETLVPCRSFREAYRAVEEGRCDRAVLPIENSTAGVVGSVQDLLFSGSLVMEGLYAIPVSQTLLGVPGAKLEEIEAVISHQQALEQCIDFIEAHQFRMIQSPNTAVAAKEVAERGDRTLAAIADRENAGLYDLSVLAEDIQGDERNYTRFVSLGRAYDVTPSPDDDAFLLMFTVRHEAGALVRAIGSIGRYGFNMTALHSRSLKGQPWAYYFHVEVDGRTDSEIGKLMLNELAGSCTTMKVVGTYKSGGMA